MPTLQEMQDGGDEGAGAAGTAEARRVEQSPFRIELRGGGWADAIGRVENAWVSRSGLYTPKGVSFTSIELDAFIFHQAAAVLQMQGMLLQDFFPPDGYFIDEQRNILARGPFVFLKGELSEPWSPPRRIKNVVLAAVYSVPEGMTREELLAVLFEELVTNKK